MISYIIMFASLFFLLFSFLDLLAYASTTFHSGRWQSPSSWPGGHSIRTRNISGEVHGIIYYTKYRAWRHKMPTPKLLWWISIQMRANHLLCMCVVSISTLISLPLSLLYRINHMLYIGLHPWPWVVNPDHRCTNFQISHAEV